MGTVLEFALVVVLVCTRTRAGTRTQCRTAPFGSVPGRGRLGMTGPSNGGVDGGAAILAQVLDAWGDAAGAVA